MSRSILERRLVDVSERLKRLRAELAVTEEQLAFLEEEAEDARLRALVAETPLADVEARDARRHADALARHRDALAPVDRRARARAGHAARPHVGRALGPLTRARARRHDRSPPASSSPRTRPSSASTSRSSSRRRATTSSARPAAATRPSSSSASSGPTSRSSTSRCPGSTASPRPATIASERLAAVLILTAFSQRELVEQARDAGALRLPREAVPEERPHPRDRDRARPPRRARRARARRRRPAGAPRGAQDRSTGPRAA